MDTEALTTYISLFVSMSGAALAIYVARRNAANQTKITEVNETKADQEELNDTLDRLSSERDKLRDELKEQLEQKVADSEQAMLKELDNCRRAAELEQAETRRELGLRFSYLLDMLENPTAVIDDSGKFIECNQTFAAHFGYLPNELRGEEITVLIPKAFRAVHSKGFKSMTDEQLFQTHYRVREVKALHRDGMEFPIRLYLSRRHVEGNGYIYYATLHMVYRRGSDHPIRELESSSVPGDVNKKGS